MKYLKNLACKFFRFTIPVMLLLCVTGTTAAQNTPVFDELKQLFENNRVFASSFVHEYNDTFTGEQQRTEGIIWVGKDRYKIESGDNIMVVDGDISRVYDSSKNRVIISDYIEEEDDFAPSRMLQGVDESYSVTEHRFDNGQTEVLLHSEDPFTIFVQVTIFLDASGHPIRIEAIDQVENELITFFEGGQFLPEETDTFNFVYPDGAEQIDLRHGS